MTTPGLFRDPVSAASERPAALQGWLVLVLMAICFFMRAINLMNMPIFGDEAIYLRWAQLIRGEGVDHPYPWVSLADPKPPLHFWLLAGVSNWTHDPLLAARLVSVFSGIVSIPLLMLVCGELAHLIRPRGLSAAVPAPTSRTLGLVASILFIFCPFLSFYQRLATADALFLGESLLIVWLALKWGRTTGTQYAAWWIPTALGGALGAALLTRQGLSYVLFAAPIIAWGLRGLKVFATHLQRRRGGRGFEPILPMRSSDLPEGSPAPALEAPRAATSNGGRGAVLRWGLLQLLLAGLIAVLIWSPYLLAELPERAVTVRRETPGQVAPPSTAPLTSTDLLAEVKRRVFYQQGFTAVTESRLDVTLRNAKLAFIPTWPQSVRETGWLFFYLTPPVYLVCLIGLVYLVCRRQWWLAAFLLAWLLLMLGPPLVFGNVIYARYILAAVPPLLIAAAFLLTDLLSAIVARRQQGARRQILGWTADAVLLAILLLPSLHQIGLQTTRWWDDRQWLTRRDRYQYVTGWDAGSATMKAVHEIDALSRVGPLVVITSNAWGLPSDAAWLYLSRLPNVQLYYTDNTQILMPAPAAGEFYLRKDKWTFQPARPVKLPPHTPILFLTGDPHHDDETPMEEFLRAGNPNLNLYRTFYGVESPGEDRVKLFVLRLPES